MTTMEMLGNELGGLLTTLETERRQRLDWLKKVALVLLAITTAVTVWQLLKGNGWFGGIFSTIASVILWAIIASRQGTHFAGVFKSLAMPELVRCLGSQLTYAPWNCIGQDVFDNCGLFISPDRYCGSDYVKGVIGRTALHFSLVLAEEEHEVCDTDTDSDGNTTTTYYTEFRDIFRGLLFSADCNKEFCGVTYVCAGGSSFLSRRRSDFVSLENPEFDRNFSVYSSDQVEARYLLTPSLMERIMELRGRSWNGLQFSFVMGRVYVALPMSLESFTPSLWRRIDDLRDVAGFYRTLRFIVGIVDDLNLNTRIWSKQEAVN